MAPLSLRYACACPLARSLHDGFALRSVRASLAVYSYRRKSCLGKIQKISIFCIIARKLAKKQNIFFVSYETCSTALMSPSNYARRLRTVRSSRLLRHSLSLVAIYKKRSVRIYGHFFHFPFKKEYHHSTNMSRASKCYAPLTSLCHDDTGQLGEMNICGHCFPSCSITTGSATS